MYKICIVWFQSGRAFKLLYREDYSTLINVDGILNDIIFRQFLTLAANQKFRHFAVQITLWLSSVIISCFTFLNGLKNTIS